MRSKIVARIRVDLSVRVQEHVAGDYPVWHTSLSNPAWAAYAELCGATGIRVERRGQLDGAFEQLFASPGPALSCVEQDAAGL